jgi:hypothetical protein
MLPISYSVLGALQRGPRSTSRHEFVHSIVGRNQTRSMPSSGNLCRSMSSRRCFCCARYSFQHVSIMRGDTPLSSATWLMMSIRTPFGRLTRMGLLAELWSSHLALSTSSWWFWKAYDFSHFRRSATGTACAFLHSSVQAGVRCSAALFLAATHSWRHRLSQRPPTTNLS